MTYRETDLLPDFPGFVAKTPRAKEIVGPLLARSVGGYVRTARGGAIVTAAALALIAAGFVFPRLALIGGLLGGIALLLGVVTLAFGESNLVDMRRLLRDGTAHQGTVSALGHTTHVQDLSRDGRSFDHEGPYQGVGKLSARWVVVSYSDQYGPRTARLSVASHEIMGLGTPVVVLRHPKARAQVAVVAPLGDGGGFRADLVLY